MPKTNSNINFFFNDTDFSRHEGKQFIISGQGDKSFFWNSLS